MVNIVPNYKSFKPSSELASHVKSKNKKKDTKAEVLLRNHIWKLGLRYRIHKDNLPGRPDIVFTKAKVVVFCDGDFWHGRNWKQLRNKLQNRANPNYWIPKIEYNIKRDKLQEEKLIKQGWKVLRFWETDILKDPAANARIIYDFVTKRKDYMPA